MHLIANVVIVVTAMIQLMNLQFLFHCLPITFYALISLYQPLIHVAHKGLFRLYCEKHGASADKWLDVSLKRDV